MVIDLSQFYYLMNEVYWDFFDCKDRVRILFGSAGSGKSFAAFQDMICKVLNEPGHNFVVCRKVANTNKSSTYALTKQIITELDAWAVFKENKTDMTFTCTHNGNMIVFKGLDDIEKMKSITFPSGVLTDIIIEEASEITMRDFNQLDTRLRGKHKVPFQITLLLNPINDQHWIKKEFFDLKSYQRDKVDANGKKIKGRKVFILKTTYKDNEFIDENYRDILESYKDIDYQYYRVYCLGEWGSYGNVIFNNYEAMACPYKIEDFDAVYYGMDFGFNHPSVISCVGLKDGNLYSFDELAVVEKTNQEFIAANEEYGILPKGVRCFADSAEPARIKEWFNAGYAVDGAVKGDESVRRGIDFLKSHKWYIDPDRCPRLLIEVQAYHWKTDKNNVVVKPEKPVDVMDDAIKATMYALEPVSRMKGKPGVLSGTLSDEKKEVIRIKVEQRKKMREIAKQMVRRRREERKKLTE